jgi:hypothetical protein
MSGQRYVPHGVYVLAERLKREGISLAGVRGPWRAVLGVVTNGVAAIAVETAERAADLSGLLNWCGVDHLEPVWSLRAPAGH